MPLFFRSFCSEWVPVICLWLSVRGRESPCEAADGDLSTADVVMVSINHRWKTEPASPSTTFSLYDVRPPHLTRSDFAQHNFSHKEKFFAT